MYLNPAVDIGSGPTMSMLTSENGRKGSGILGTEAVLAELCCFALAQAEQERTNRWMSEDLLFHQ